MAQAPVSGFSMTCFLFFAIFTACLAAYHHKVLTFFGEHNADDWVDEMETRRNLLIATSVLLGITSFIFYPAFKCSNMQTMLGLRLLGNLTAMLIYLGYEAGVLDEDGIDSQAMKNYSFSNASDWGSTVAFACAWVMIATFEINETVLCHRQITRWIVKFQVFMFWALVSVSMCIPAEKLLDDVDVTDTESVYSKLLIAASAACALGALMFAIYCTCEVQEFLKLHMLFGGLFVILFISSQAYESYNWRKDLNESYTPEIRERHEMYQELYDHWLFLKNVQDAAAAFLAFAMLQVVGFGNYFSVSQQKVVSGPVAKNQVIQLEVKL